MKAKKILSKTLSVCLSIIMIMILIPIVNAAEYDSTGETKLAFSDKKITAQNGDYKNYEIDGTDLTINGEGTYVVSGSCSDGSITVKKGVTGVTLVLNGLSLTSSDTAPLTCNKSTQVNIVAASGTKNTLTDSEKNNDENYSDNENAENAVLKCKDGSKVTICGSGTLNINANGKNGIKSGATTDEEGEASLEIKDVTLNITAKVNDGINAGQLLNIKSGKITVTAKDDGIHCDYVMNIGAQGESGPTINITDCYEGLEAAKLYVYSGDIKIHSEDDCMNAANSDLTNYDFELTIAGGTLYMDTESGDGIDSNGTLTISGGTTEVWTANRADNQPLDADGAVSITGGTVFAAGASSGMGMKLNAAQPYVIYGSSSKMGGGMGGQQPQGMDGQQNGDSNNQPPQKPDGEQEDGQNGMQGEPPQGMPNGQQGGQSGNEPPQKPDGEQENGQNDMQGESLQEMPNDENAEQSSGQSSISVNSGSEISIKDSSGKTIYTTTAPCNVSYIVFSSADLTADSEFELFSDNSSIATATAAAGTSGSQSSTKSDVKLTDNSAQDTASATENVDTSDFSQPAKTVNVLFVTLICIAAAGLLGGGIAVIIVLRKKKSPSNNNMPQ